MELAYCLNNWRNRFAAAATESVKVMINDNADYFQTSKDIKDYIVLCLEEVPVNPEHRESTGKGDSEVKPLMTAAYQWREWNDGKKKQVGITLLIVRSPSHKCFRDYCKIRGRSLILNRHHLISSHGISTGEGTQEGDYKD